MSVLIALAALGLLMLAAYRGYSVILFAPIAALGAVLLTDPGARYAADPEHHPHQLLWYQRLGRTVAGAYRLSVYYRLWPALAGAPAA